MDPSKFAKVLSLAASDNEAEALRAIQTAKRMLAGVGLDFVDLANLVTRPGGGHEAETVDALRETIALLRRENRQLKGENRRLRAGSSIPRQGGAEEIIEAERRLATEREARLLAEAASTQLAAEIRCLKAAAASMKDALARGELERYRGIAEARKLALAAVRGPVPRRSSRGREGQYSLF